MRAVNLIAKDSRRGGGRIGPAQVPVFVGLGLLAVALVFVTLYVLTNNTIASREAKLASLHAQVAQAQAEARALGNYAQFAKLAENRIVTVREIAATRFDWHSALAALSKVIPANTSLQSLNGSVAAGGSAGGGAGSGLRSDEPGPDFELTGCTSTQDNVAQLLSRLRLINGVTRVTLVTSQKSTAPQSGASVATTTSSASSAAASSSASTVGCGGNAPTFDVLVFFNAIPGATPTGAVPGASTATTPGGHS